MSAEEAASRIREAEADAHYAESDLARIDSLHLQRLVPERDLERANADAQKRGPR